MKNRETEHQIAGELWNLWAFGSEKAENGPSFTGAAGVGKSVPIGRRQMTNPLKLMVIAVKPLASPPFPLERLEQMMETGGYIAPETTK